MVNSVFQDHSYLGFHCLHNAVLSETLAYEIFGYLLYITPKALCKNCSKQLSNFLNYFSEKISLDIYMNYNTMIEAQGRALDYTCM